jgi:hypothetical protein
MHQLTHLSGHIMEERDLKAVTTQDMEYGAAMNE